MASENKNSLLSPTEKSGYYRKDYACSLENRSKVVAILQSNHFMSRENQQTPFTTQAEAFGAFLRNTDQKQVQHVAVLEGLQSYPDIWERANTEGSEFRALYVGVGTGGLEIPLTMEFVKARGGNHKGITIDCVDPSAQMESQFRANAAKVGIADRINSYVRLPFESSEYQAPTADLAIASHVLYYVGNWGVNQDGSQKVPFDDNALVKLARAVKERGGVAHIALQSIHSNNTQLRIEWSPRITGNQEIYGEQITTELKRLNISYKSQVIEARTKVSSCFQNGQFNPTPEGEKILTFITRAPGGWNELDNATKQEFGRDMSQIVEENQEEILYFRDTYIWIPVPKTEL